MSDHPEHARKSAATPTDAGPDPTFDALYQRYSREVWAAVYARCLDADLAMDVTQETFLRLWKQREAGDEIVNVRAWLFRVARNLAEDAAKSAFRRNGTQPAEVMGSVRSPGQSPLDAMARDELFAQVREVLNDLAPPDRELLTLRYAMDYDSPQIAEVLGVNVSAVHMRLSRARQRLAERLAVLGIEGPL